MRFVPVKTDEQLDMHPFHRVRERWIMRRTAVVNEILGYRSSGYYGSSPPSEIAEPCARATGSQHGTVRLRPRASVSVMALLRIEYSKRSPSALAQASSSRTSRFLPDEESHPLLASVSYGRRSSRVRDNSVSIRIDAEV